MEDKWRDSSGTPPPPASMDAQASEHPTSTRRRGGGHKRKSVSVNSGGGNSSTSLGNSSKRQAREKLPPVLFPTIHTNGPCTRARVHPHNSNSLYEATVVNNVVDMLDMVAKVGDLSIVSEDLEALGAKIEAEYEAIRSRDANVHVVPTHAGWFMWTKVHPLEERMLPSFFNGKSQSRNSDVYIAIRNSLMKKFHYNPNQQIDVKYLSELTVGELDARQEVMEFLDYWGLINYHPFPPIEPVAMPINADVKKGEAPEMDSSLVNKLFKFETLKSWMPVTPRTNLEMPTMSSGLFPEYVVTDELLKSDGPSVEYHCNSCSTDCSRKRYHCQKQADFDLCADCFNNGKFGSDMSPSDFILMESTEAAGTSGGNWTDQETILLLEAIELFRDNWTEIAEHVATKTKAQCIMHFVQMPIEDAFFRHEDISDDAHKENAKSLSTSNEDSTLKSDPDCDTSLKDLPDDAEGKGDMSENKDGGPNETPNPDEIKESNDCVEEVGDSFLSKALKEAFEAVGSFSSHGESLSFADAGNPVMALAAFLIRLIDPNVVTASVHSLVKFTSGNYSSEELAARHCFPLEDPPYDDNKNHLNSEGAKPSTTECETQKDGDLHAEKHDAAHNSKAGKTGSHDFKGVRKDSTITEHGKKSASKGQKTGASSAWKPAKKSVAKKAKGIVTKEEAQLASENGPSNLAPSKESDSKLELQTGASVGCSSQDKTPRDEDMTFVSENEAVDTSRNKKHNAGGGEAKEDGTRSPSPLVKRNDIDLGKLKRAAVTALSAAAVKAKLLADQEEDEILRLSVFLAEKQLYKVETKLAFLHEIDNIAMRGKEQIDKLKVKVLHERAQIVASRIGTRISNPQVLLPNRPIASFPNPAMRPPSAGLNLPRPMTSMNPASFINATSMFTTQVQPNVE